MRSHAHLGPRDRPLGYAEATFAVQERRSLLLPDSWQTAKKKWDVFHPGCRRELFGCQAWEFADSQAGGGRLTLSRKIQERETPCLKHTKTFTLQDTTSCKATDCQNMPTWTQATFSSPAAASFQEAFLMKSAIASRASLLSFTVARLLLRVISFALTSARTLVVSSIATGLRPVATQVVLELSTNSTTLTALTSPAGRGAALGRATCRRLGFPLPASTAPLKLVSGKQRETVSFARRNNRSWLSLWLLKWVTLATKSSLRSLAEAFPCVAFWRLVHAAMRFCLGRHPVPKPALQAPTHAPQRSTWRAPASCLGRRSGPSGGSSPDTARSE